MIVAPDKVYKTARQLEGETTISLFWFCCHPQRAEGFTWGTFGSKQSSEGIVGMDDSITCRERSLIRAVALTTWWLMLALGLIGSTVLVDRVWAQTETSPSDLQLSGRVEISQVQIAFIGSGTIGSGKLFYGDRVYKFAVSGLGIGGFGISTVEATGGVYNLNRVRDFQGLYGQVRYGLAVGELSTGELWLQNANDVFIRLNADREGLALAIGVDGIYLQLK